MKTYIVTGDSINWCGFEEHRIVEVADYIDEDYIKDNMTSRFENFMRDYIGEPEDYEEDEWANDDYAACTFTVDEYNEADHGPKEHYETLEGF